MPRSSSSSTSTPISTFRSDRGLRFDAMKHPVSMKGLSGLYPLEVALMLALLPSCGSTGGGETYQSPDYPTVFKDVPVLDVGYDVPAFPDPGHESFDGQDGGIDAGDSGNDPDTSDPSGPLDPGSVDDPGPCQPDCANKGCGGDGCGGKCGVCPTNHECIASTCVCVPDCANRECGDDGCGKTCNPGCEPGVLCLDWGLCANFGPCSSSSTLTCSESSVSGDTGWSGNSDVMDVYSCDPTPAHGPEKAFLFSPTVSGDIKVSLEGAFIGPPPEFLNVYLLEARETAAPP